MTTVYIDGGCRRIKQPNGLAAYGVYVQHQGRVIELKQVLAVPATNNQAEYCGLIAALRWAKDANATPLLVRADSQLVVYQMHGRYQVHDKKLIPLYLEAERLLREVGQVTIEWIRRERNAEADRLCNEAMDEAEGKLRRQPAWSNRPHFSGV